MPSHSDSSRRGSSDRSRLIVLVTALLAVLISIVSLPIGVYVLFDMRSDKHSKSQSLSASKNRVGTIACIKCEEGQVKWSRTVDDKGTHLCCAESTEQMSALLDLTLSKPVEKQQEQDKIEPTTWGTNFSLASAHKRLIPPEIFNSSINTTPVFGEEMVKLKLNDSYTDTVNEHVRNVQVLQTGFKVNLQGLYLVYSNIHFKPDSSHPCSTFTYKTWEQKVMKEGHMELLRSVHTCCDSCTSDKETSYAGGTFYLKAGDNLYVSVSGLGLLSFRTQSSYFGLVMLGE